MPRINHTLQGSTLVETLVMMLVAGIVFLAVMDGLTLFTRLQARRTEALLTAGRQCDGYFRIESLVAGADSILTGHGELEIYRSGRRTVLSLCDSAVVYHSGDFRDTLLRDVMALGLSGDDPDTLQIGLTRGFTVRFPVVFPVAEQYRRSLDKIENGYGYEE